MASVSAATSPPSSQSPLTQPGTEVTETVKTDTSTTAEQDRVGSGQANPSASPAAQQRPQSATAAPARPSTRSASNAAVDQLAAATTPDAADMHRSAARTMEALFKAKGWGSDIKADRTYIATIQANPVKGGGWEAQVVAKTSLADALIENMQEIPYGRGRRIDWSSTFPFKPVKVKDKIPYVPRMKFNRFSGPLLQSSSTKTDTYYAIWQGDASGNIAPQIEAGKQLNVPPSQVLPEMWNASFDQKFQDELKTFWDKHYPSYGSQVKAAFIKAAHAQREEGSLSEEAFQLAMRGAQIPADKPWNQITKEDLCKPHDTNDTLDMGLLEVNSRLSTDLLYVRDTKTGKTLLHIPGNSSPIHTFGDLDTMKRWIAKSCASEEKAKAFAEHFALKDRKDGWERAGVDTTLLGLGKWPDFYRINKRFFSHANQAFSGRYPPEDHITRQTIVDPFEAVASQTRQRTEDDAKTAITSKSDWREKAALGVVSKINTALLPLAFLAPEVALLAYGITGGIEAAIGADQLSRGKPDAWEHVAWGVLNALPLLGKGVGKALGVAANDASRTAEVASSPRPTGIVGPEETLEGRVEGSPDASSETPPPPARPKAEGFSQRPMEGLGKPQANGLYTADGKSYAKLDGRPNAVEVRETGGKLRMVRADSSEPNGPALKYNPSTGFYESELGALKHPGQSTVASPPGKYEIDGQDIGQVNLDLVLDADSPAMERAAAKGKQLLEDAHRDLPEALITRPPPVSLPSNPSDAEVVKRMLDGADGMVVGEAHSAPEARAFLQKNMKALADAGVERFYVELPNEVYGQSLRDFQLTGKADELLSSIPGDSTASVPLLDTIKAARKAGIDTWPMDTLSAGDAGRNTRPIENRIFAFNKYATDTIRADQASGDAGKFVALAGATHVDTARVRGLTIPGLADTTHARSLNVVPANVPVQGEARVVERDKVTTLTSADGSSASTRADLTISPEPPDTPTTSSPGKPSGKALPNPVEASSDPEIKTNQGSGVDTLPGDDASNAPLYGMPRAAKLDGAYMQDDGHGIYTAPGRDGTFISMNNRWYRARSTQNPDAVLVVDPDRPYAFRNPTYARRGKDGKWQVFGRGGLAGGEDDATLARTSEGGALPPATSASTAARPLPPPDQTVLNRYSLRKTDMADTDGIYTIKGKSYVRPDGYKTWSVEVDRNKSGDLALVTHEDGTAVGPRLRKNPGDTTYDTYMAEPGDVAVPGPASSSQRFQVTPEEANAYDKYDYQEVREKPFSAEERDEWEALKAKGRKQGAELVEEAFRRLPMSRVRRPPAVEIPSKATDAQVIESKLKDANGLVVGENHDLPQARSFFINNMATLAKQGVKSLYVELPAEIYGSSIEAFNRSGKVDAVLEGIAGNDENTISLLDVMKEARKNKITVIASDTVVASDVGGNDAISSPFRRMWSYNMHATDVIRSHQARPDAGKFAALVGHKHADTIREGGITVPGLADTTGGRSLILDGQKASVGTYDAGHPDLRLGDTPRAANIDPQGLVAVNGGYYTQAPGKNFVKVGNDWYRVLGTSNPRIAALIDADHASAVGHQAYASRDEHGEWVLHTEPETSRKNTPQTQGEARKELTRLTTMKPQEATANARGDAAAIAVDKLSSRSNAATLPLVETYIATDAVKINRMLRRPMESKVPGDMKEAGNKGQKGAGKGSRKQAREKFMRQFNQLNNYHGMSYRTTRITEKVARALMSGEDLVFADKGVQSASTQPFNLAAWEGEWKRSDGKDKGRLPDGKRESRNAATTTAVFVFDPSVPQKNLSTRALPDHVAVPPGTRLRVVASEKRDGVVYVYLGSSPSPPTAAVVDLSNGSRSTQTERNRLRPSRAS
jgi:hypothetical protein